MGDHMDIIAFRKAVIHHMEKAGLDPRVETELLMNVCLAALQYAKDYHTHLQRQEWPEALVQYEGVEEQG